MVFSSLVPKGRSLGWDWQSSPLAERASPETPEWWEELGEFFYEEGGLWNKRLALTSFEAMFLSFMLEKPDPPSMLPVGPRPWVGNLIPVVFLSSYICFNGAGDRRDESL